jgi:hypothetical protein
VRVTVYLYDLGARLIYAIYMRAHYVCRMRLIMRVLYALMLNHDQRVSQHSYNIRKLICDLIFVNKLDQKRKIKRKKFQLTVELTRKKSI